MNEPIDIKEILRQKLVDKIMEEWGKKNNKAGEVANSYYQLMSENPMEAVQRLPEFIEKVRNVNENKALTESVAGPNQDWTAPMFNVLGIIYPTLEKDARKEGLVKVLGFLDQLNYYYAQPHVALISEPWLVGDIIINRSFYWCGYQEYCDFLDENKSWAQFLHNKGKVESEFWMAMAVIFIGHASQEVRKNFYEQNHDLIDRTQDAIAAISFDHAQREKKENGTPIEEYLKKSLSKYDPLLRDNIREKITEEKWVRL